ncbi:MULTISPECIES: LacI family DNA-binding transcriptional regulator [Microbacterium]|jgi:DNA-binding LacI/PurR family transcriptional regulator|uniref:LacI family DNA-binding transcriptional regulator n=1 Tax=Microbacterium TaxID=33882 RepID=UPI001D171BE1|nr:LacI family DNA-binding transcriptional regulator [Microbacterium testaceum]MCC4247522.1 LacI family DNA-binding transcriptional regulator [Microbacterium testaceum]
MRVSMADVAAAAGVSAQTVSRVANGSPRVDPATRARVEKAMADLGYRMHRAARALRTGQTSTIGLVVSTLASVGNSRMLQAISEAAAARDYALAVVTVGERGIRDAFARLRSQGVDGAVVLNEATDLARVVDPPADLHLVVVDSPPDERFSIVQTDHAGGARAATEHLLGLGHATVHHLAGPAGSFAAAERERGWREALVDVGAPVPEPARGDWTSASGHRSAAALAAATAVFVANDQMALGVLRALADAGRRVPDDVAVVGFDDIVDAAEFRPPLTTVRQDFDALGRGVVEALVSAIERGTARAATVPAVLVVRASSSGG